MHIVLSHVSALQFWLTASPDLIQTLLDQRPQRFPRTRLSITRQDAAQVSAQHGLPMPFDALVARSGERRRNASIATHLHPSAFNRKHCFHVCEGLYVCSPELVFAQISNDPRFSKLELIWICHLLCGTWMPWDNEWGQIDRRALATPKGCLALIDSMSLGNKSRAKSAASLTCANAASAGEVALSMSIVLPHRLGGLHALLPGEIQMNPKVTIPGSAADHRRPDLLVPEINLALEYQGELAHSGEETYVRDAGRQIELASKNIEILTITKKQLFNDQAMDSLGRIMCARLGRKYRPRGAHFYQQRHELQRFLTLHMIDPLQCCRAQPVPRRRRRSIDEESDDGSDAAGRNDSPNAGRDDAERNAAEYEGANGPKHP